MFAGIIEGLGRVVSLGSGKQPGGGAAFVRLDVDLGGLLHGLRPGASVAVNGACLTLAGGRQTIASFDVIPETMARTNLRYLSVGDEVNVERALKIGDRLDGHFVQGHVDGTASVQRVDRTSGQWKLWLQLEAELMPFTVPKGSIAIDGVSLTVVNTVGNSISVALIPTTLNATTLGRRKPGDIVNIETDILARLIVHRLTSLGADGRIGGHGLTWDTLREGGFI